MRRVCLTVLVSLAFLATPVPAQPASGAVVESEATYLVRCRRETIAAYPSARAQADSICQSNWQMIVAAGPMADALLALAPATGTTFDAATARTRLAAVRWGARPSQGQVASGRLGDVDVGVTRTPAPGVAFNWYRNGEVIPFNLEQAVRVRGATTTMIGCQVFGAGEGTSVYRVAAPGKAPFVLTIATREAAVASQSSTFSAVADFSGRASSLATLRRDGSDWSPTCPQ